jgi:hypothetical protein
MGETIALARETRKDRETDYKLVGGLQLTTERTLVTSFD